MECKNRKRLLKELADASENPREFIYNIMALQNQKAPDVAQKAGIKPAHFYVLMHELRKGNGMGAKMCCNIAKGLDIDPFIISRLVADYSLKVFQKSKKKNNGADKNNQEQTTD